MSTPAPPDRFVLDGSVTLAWLFHDEADPYADAIVAKLPALEMLVPCLWHLEIANVLLVGERRGRSSQADTTSWLSYLSGLPIVVDGATEARAWTDTLNLARQLGLTAYDAAYLELALREGVPLATLDAKLRAAAQTVGVPLYQP
ncbi:MAG: type II toxin-antitoxin system VapC family toxin [Planctomycetaceae bacterium]|nr:type II toxin-antitoxin system VapC family toxin [Planctomycetaceae bacterium]MBV8383739.1 type II toxin-antitoxin system VapC family toxin [Planctomycetaceae bacterium]MBV8678237.1 type II toxin-antitoxin system VapC family toxin [Planctomycetaceae bacterium]